MTSPFIKDVLIIGAGMAGLAAARALAERGMHVTVLEARDRVGGRILTHNANGATVELGAEFVHGRPPELWALIEEAGLEAIERDGSMLRTQSMGGLTEDDPQGEKMFAPLEALTDFEGPDVSFADWLTASDVPEEDRQALLGYVEGFNAADASRIGIHGLGAQQKAEDATEGDRAWHITGGYAQLTEYLAERVRSLGGEIVLGVSVTHIHWQPGSVRVLTQEGTAFQASQCLVTLPLGVLQRTNRGGVEMHPEPPPIAAARRMEMGHAARFTMVLRRALWEELSVGLPTDALHTMSFLFTPAAFPRVWWTPHPEPGPPMLTGWVGGPQAFLLGGKTGQQLGHMACQALADVFSIEGSSINREILSVHMHDWTRDPFALGAYSNVPVDALDAPRAMTEPAQDTIFFAGEHTDITGHWGTVHAALRSGLRAAAQILGDPPS